MPGRRFWYLTALTVSGCVYIAYGEWLGWILLLSVLLLPLLSLALSLPAIWQFRLVPTGPERLAIGEAGSFWLLGSCDAPMPPFRGKLRLERCFTGETRYYNPDKGFAPEHCGGIRVAVERPRVCDYLGLFSFRVRKQAKKTLYVLPKPVEAADLPDLHALTAQRWHPKPGGGFSENHELREYHPGDSLTGIHWKLSAKTGNLMVRQPMEPEWGLALVTMTLRGTPEELDRKLGRLLWVGENLLKQEIRFELRVLTGEGILLLPVGTREALEEAVMQLLCQRTAEQGSIQEHTFQAVWQYHIGGEPDAV